MTAGAATVTDIPIQGDTVKKSFSLLLLCAAITATSMAADTEGRQTSPPAAHTLATARDGGSTVVELAGRPVAAAAVTEPFTRLFSSDSGAGRWNPCQVVRWKMNTDGYTKRRFNQVVKAVRQLRRATGLTIRYDGLTTPEEIKSLEPGVITVSFVSPKEMPKDVVGTAGVAQDLFSLGGGILRADVRIALHTAYDPRAGYVPVLLHELGHAVGLGHSNDKRSAMYAYQNGAARYNRNDLTGLRTVGAVNGCVLPTPEEPTPDTTPPQEPVPGGIEIPTEGPVNPGHQAHK
jgi:hypothetical protein